MKENYICNKMITHSISRIHKRGLNSASHVLCHVVVQACVRTRISLIVLARIALFRGGSSRRRGRGAQYVRKINVFLHVFSPPGEEAWAPRPPPPGSATVIVHRLRIVRLSSLTFVLSSRAHAI